jgi:hypothetical protein
MYVFSRSLRLAPGQMRESITWAGEITAKVNEASELRFAVWTPVFSPGVGQLTWATLTEDLAAVEALEAKLMADDGYIDLVERGVAFSSGEPADDQLVQLIHQPDSWRQEPPAYVAVVRAMAANGNFGRAVEVGVKIAETAQRIGGAAISFGLAATGPYGEVQWISGYDDVAQLQQAQQAINSSPEFIELLDREAATAYISGASSQIVGRRVI